MYGNSDKGMKRPGNEDSYYCSEDEGIAIVADGMGGHASGEVASALAVRIIREYVLSAIDNCDGRNPNAQIDPDWLCRVLANAISEANNVIYSKSGASFDSASRMGTTITSFVKCNDAAALAHVGDSRIYLFRNGKLFPLTQDHSLVNEQVRANLITAEEARTSVYRHIVTRALGMKDSVESDTQSIFLLDGDRIMLCTDGLFDLVEDSVIKSVLESSGDNLKSAVHRLISIANERGGDDNITIALVRLVADEKLGGINDSDDKTQMFEVN